MHIRRFQGKTVQAALEKAKEELGDDAIIMHTRPVRSGRLRSNSYVEITVASDSEALSTLGSQSVDTSLKSEGRRRSGQSPSSGEVSPPASDLGRTLESPSAATDTIKQIVERANTILTASNYGRQRVITNGVQTTTEENIEGEESVETQTSDNDRYVTSYIGSELSEIRDVLHILLNSARLEHATDLPEIFLCA